MYICVCKGISDKKLRETYSRNKGNVKDTLRSLGIGSDCGLCVQTALNEIDSELSHHKVSKTEIKPPRQA